MHGAQSKKQTPACLHAGTVAGSAQSMGSSGSFSSVPKMSEGVQVHAFSFKPLSGSSKLLIETPPIPVGETKNVADDFRIAGKPRVHVHAMMTRSLRRPQSGSVSHLFCALQFSASLPEHCWGGVVGAIHTNTWFVFVSKEWCVRYAIVRTHCCCGEMVCWEAETCVVCWKVDP